MNIFDQNELIDNLKNGNEESFKFLYNTYGSKIYTLAYRMLGDKEEAEDKTQDTFIQVFRNIKNFNGNSQLYTWIYTIAKNLCYRSLQNKSRNSFASLESLIHSVQNRESPSEITELEKNFLIQQVKEGCLTGLLQCLSFYQRTSFILHVFIGLSVKEISMILNKSEGATKILIHRARQNLKKFLCSNCSLYNRDNPCHCENLIDFSLKQNWIKKPTKDELGECNFINTTVIEKEIEDIRKISILYKNLSEAEPPKSLHQRMQQVIANKDWLIFQPEKA